MMRDCQNRFRRLTQLIGLLLVSLTFSPVVAHPLQIADATTEAKLDPSQQADVTRFITTIGLIKKDYAKSISDKNLLENAIRGMVNNLDPHSEYLDEEAYKSLLMTTSGEFGGLGIEVTSQYGVLKIVTPIDGTPAAKAGIKSGDFIVALNNKNVSDMSSDKAIDEMRGKKGTPILLTVIRPGVKEPINFNLVRDTIHMDSIKSKLLAGNYGYIRISQFQEPTTGLLISALKNLETQAKGHLQGVILDLRNNPGGLLETAVSVSNVFLNSAKLTQFNKLIVYTEGRVPDSQYKAYATGQDLINNVPLIILINEGSASASEIVTGALQDYKRAVVVGTRSFGKGSVQTVLPLDDTHAVKLTTALYHTPSGRLIQNQGITPDIYVPNNIKATENKDASTFDPVREFQLKDHLANVVDKTDPNLKTQDVASIAVNDFQLYEALNIMHALALHHQAE